MLKIQLQAESLRCSTPFHLPIRIFFENRKAIWHSADEPKTKESIMAKEIVKHRKDEKKKPTLTAKEKKAKKQEKKQK